MSLLTGILANNILPIFIAIGAGYALARFTILTPSALSKSVFYIFTPCLAYTMLTGATIEANEISRIALVSVSVSLVSAGLAFAVARALKLGRTMTTALMLTAMFTNAGNYGLSLNLLAFGEEALQRATVYFVTSSIMVNTVGIFLASSGKLSLRQALAALLKYPTIYAVIIAALSVISGIKLPAPIMIPVEVLAGASIPVMLVLLGVHMAEVKGIEQIKLAGVASALRLVVAPLVAITMVTLLDLTGPARQAAVLQASMPSAIVVTVLAIEFDVEPGFVTSSVVLATLLSPITLTLIVAFLS